MITLQRTNSPNRYLILLLSASLLIFVNLTKLDAPYPFLWTSVLFILGVSLWLRFGRKPSSWIIDDNLYIFNGIYSPYCLRRNSLKELRCREKSEKGFILEALLTNNTIYSIVIENKKEHIQNDRLINFINENFMEIQQTKLA